MKAWNLTRAEIVYRHDAFSAGLRAAGYDVRSGNPEGAPGNVLLIWNRYPPFSDLATRFEAAGGIALICENGYLGPNGCSPHHMEPRSIYALARSYHNDASVVRMGQDDRWSALGVPVQPWRASGGHVLVCENRPFGAPGRAMPANWAQDVAGRLRKLTKREIRIRPHPGNAAPHKRLAEDLAGAWACVIWSSSAGVHALVRGIPVYCEARYWICKGGEGEATEGVETDIRFIECGPRLGMYPRNESLQRLAWAQWSVEEIASGEPFRHLLHSAEQVQVAPVA